MKRIFAFVALMIGAIGAHALEENITTNTQTSTLRCDKGHLDVYVHGDWGSPAATVAIQFKDELGNWVNVDSASWSKSGSETVNVTVNCVRRSAQQEYRANVTGGTGHDLQIGIWADFE